MTKYTLLFGLLLLWTFEVQAQIPTLKGNTFIPHHPYQAALSSYGIYEREVRTEECRSYEEPTFEDKIVSAVVKENTLIISSLVTGTCDSYYLVYSRFDKETGILTLSYINYGSSNICVCTIPLTCEIELEADNQGEIIQYVMWENGEKVHVIR